MRKSVVCTARAPKPSGCYSQAIKVGGWVFTAGNGGMVPSTGEVALGGVRAQVKQALENIRAILEEAGASIDNVVKVNAYLRDIGDWEAYNEVYSEYFDPVEPPARTTVEVGGFPGEMAVEIDVIAYIPD